MLSKETMDVIAQMIVDFAEKGGNNAWKRPELKMFGIAWPIQKGVKKEQIIRLLPPQMRDAINKLRIQANAERRAKKLERKAKARARRFAEHQARPHVVAAIAKKKAKHERFTTVRGFYSSEEWLKLRHQVLLHYGPKCMLCNATRADGIKLHVDHIKPRSKFPHLELVFENLQILCEDCNIGKSASDSTDWRPT